MSQFHTSETMKNAVPSPDGEHIEPLIGRKLPSQELHLRNYMSHQDYPTVEQEGDTPVLEDMGTMILPSLHRHTFSYQLNAGHTVIRGCVTCGLTHASYVMGNPGDLIWHEIAEQQEA